MKTALPVARICPEASAICASSEVTAAVGFAVARGEGQRNGEGNGAEVVDLQVAGHSEDIAGAVGLAHGLVEQSRDDAAVGVAGRSGKAAGEAGVADDVASFVDEEAEAHAGGIGESAAEAVVECAVSEGGEGGVFWNAGHGLRTIYRNSEIYCCADGNEVELR